MAIGEILGLGVAINGFKKFMSEMGDMDKSIGNQGKKWDGLGKIAAGAGKLLGGAVKIGLAAVATAGAAATGAVVGLGIALFKLAKDAAPLEGIGNSYGVLSTKFGVSLDDMRAAAKGTIADFDLMKVANVALTGAGKDLGAEFGKALPGLLEAARAAAQATGQDVDFLFNSLVSGIKRGSPMLIDNTGLVLKLGEANEAYAASMGITVEQMSAEDKQIAILRATLAAGKEMTALFGNENLTVAEKMAAAKARMKNLTDSIGMALLPALGALFGAGTGITDGMGPKLIEWATVLGEWLGEKLPLAIEAVSTWVSDTLIPALANVWGFIQTNVIPVLITVAQWLQTNIPLAIEAVSAWFTTTLIPTLETVWQYIQENIVPILTTVWGWLQTNIPLAIATASTWFTTTLVPALETVWQYITDNVIPILSDTWDWLQTKVPLALQTLSDYWELTLLPALKDVWKFITDSVIPALEEAWDWIATNLPPALADLAKYWNETLLPALKDVWQFIQDNLTPILAGIAASVLTVVIPAVAAMAVELLTVTIPALVATVLAMSPIILVVAAIGIAVGLLVKAWTSDWLGIRTTVTDAWELHIKPACQAIVDWFTITLPNAVNEFKTVVSEKIEEARLAIIGFKDKFITAGEDLINGVKEGIKNKYNDLKQQAVDNLRGALQSVKDAFGIGSPSKVFAAEVGENTGLGIAVGIEKSTSAAVRAMGNLMAAVAYAAKGYTVATGDTGTILPTGTKGYATSGTGAEMNSIIASLAKTVGQVTATTAGRSYGGGGGGGGGVPSVIEKLAVSQMIVEQMGVLMGMQDAAGNVTQNYYQLTTNALTQPGALALEFQSMAMAMR